LHDALPISSLSIAPELFLGAVQTSSAPLNWPFLQKKHVVKSPSSGCERLFTQKAGRCPMSVLGKTKREGGGKAEGEKRKARKRKAESGNGETETERAGQEAD